jgi:hypothetical protein
MIGRSKNRAVEVEKALAALAWTHHVPEEHPLSVVQARERVPSQRRALCGAGRGMEETLAW